ncbi:SRPBCC family protein [Geodermatophilus sp. TF02-6]|uniref:SRPBCC family protein n=1 Tax=Geodermatophilus sp. TF02-6 TaxID=2250575 RepID=UPI000DE8820E|nr:SRPBCC family protein [Geodermatophilus sp. TF02-6]RBY80965.1 SRPBCC family protein [Geodermatophilus sp. TF02-6]
MGDFTASTTVGRDPQSLFDYLSDVGNLPRYFSRMTSAEPGQGEEVHTTARMPDGQEVQADAWFRVDTGAQRIEWGSEGPNDYHGHLDVRPDGGGSEVEVYLHTTRVDDGNQQVEDGLRETLANIKQQVEGGSA